MKTIRVPFVEGLEIMDAQQIEAALSMPPEPVAEVNWPERFPYAPECSVRLARSRSALAVSFSVRGMDLRATQMEDNGRSWEDSCCEFFICPGGEDYYNVEITCIGSILMAKGPGRNGRVQLDKAEVAKIRRWTSLERKPYDIEGGDHAWRVTVLIPFELIGLDPENLPKEVRANFYKCGDLTAHPRFLSWNPITTPNPDFHRPEFFGRLIIF